MIIAVIVTLALIGIGVGLGIALKSTPELIGPASSDSSANDVVQSSTSNESSTESSTDSTDTALPTGPVVTKSGAKFLGNGNKCTRGFVVTLRNKKDLYNFSAMDQVEE